MKTIKSKIERVEKETKRIEAINKLITCCEAAHLKPVATYVNGSTFGQVDAVVIDKSIMIQMLAEQKLTIELEIENDVKFLEAIELMVSPKESKPCAAPAPQVPYSAAMAPPMPMSR